jgi:hypothetical protein
MSDSGHFRDHPRDEQPLYDYGTKLSDSSREKRKTTFWRVVATFSFTITVVVVLGAGVSFYQGWLVVRTLSPAPTPVVRLPLPVATPTPAPVVSLNLKLTCEQCQQPGVAAALTSATTDVQGDITFVVNFTNQTNQAVDMKVDTIKLLDQDGTAFSLVSNDPYAAAAAGQTLPITIVFNLQPQAGTQYIFSIVVEEADVFANFYQSPSFSLTQA